MLPGYNHNVRHRETLFHVQTEDNGTKNPYIITTLFHEGNVMALRRSSYSKFVNAENRDEIVRSMMQEQHKDMMKDLVQDRIRNVAHLFPGVAQNPQIEKVVIPAPSPPKTPIVETPAQKTLEVDGTAEKTLDELILEFLQTEKQGKA